MSESNLPNFRLPPPLTHLKRLTTRDGLVQHADKEVPDPAFGYSLDDNARALIVCLWYSRLFKNNGVGQLAEIYFSYVKRVEREGGTFHNFLSFTEKVLDHEGSEDSVGRAIWALGETVALSTDEKMKTEALAIFKRASIRKHLEHPHVRAKAYILLGLAAVGDKEEAARWADCLVGIFESNADSDWVWFENSLRYANGIIPYALTRAYQLLQDKTYLEVAKLSFEWLDKQSRDNGVPSPIGQDGWYFKGGEKARYDQQPIEAADMVLAVSALFEATGKEKYLTIARDWMGWYFSNNINKQSLIDNKTGGVRDGLTPQGLNENQGAESIVTYLLAYLSLSKLYA